jgi:hypothetical protein
MLRNTQAEYIASLHSYTFIASLLTSSIQVNRRPILKEGDFKSCVHKLRGRQNNDDGVEVIPSSSIASTGVVVIKPQYHSYCHPLVLAQRMEHAPYVLPNTSSLCYIFVCCAA